MDRRSFTTVVAQARADEMAALRELFQEYQAALGIDLSFQGFAAELESLPGEYAPPRGCMLIARCDFAIAGCVALRPLADDLGEMKRLYVRPAFRAHGVGSMLLEQLLTEGRALGYRRIVLDTLPAMAGARRLYESFGFQDIPPYRENPIAGARFLGLDL